MYLSEHLPENFHQRSFVVRCAVLFLLLATIRGVLFRAPFMEFINLSNFTLYPFIDNIPKLTPLVVIAIGTEAWTREKRGIRATLIVGTLIAAIATLLISPVVKQAFAGVLRFTEAREGNQRYGLPYNWHILLPAYLTFFEPVIAAFVIGRAIVVNCRAPRLLGLASQRSHSCAKGPGGRTSVEHTL